MKTLIVLAALAVAGCSSSTSESAPTTTRTPVGQVAQKTTQEVSYLAGLTEINPGLSVHEERALRRGRRICERLNGGSNGGMSVSKYVVLELSGGNATISEAEAHQAIDLAKATICKS